MRDRHGPTWLLIAACALLILPLLGAKGCPPPTPQPTPTPIVTPTPPALTCANLDCVPGYHCTETSTGPVCIPDPEPTPTPVPACKASLQGDPKMDINMHASNRNFDATPKIYNADRCREVGYPGRLTCPVLPEGHPDREVCEQKLMGGTSPDWQMRNGTGDLRIELDGGWMGRLYGTGTGEIRACYPNGNACSDWLAVSL